MTEIVAELSGTLYDKLSRSSRPVYLRVKGNAMAVDAGEPGDPPGIWGGGNVPMPSPPIANVPGVPGYQPPGGGGPDHIWGPNDPRPNPPIAFPPGWVGGVPPLPPNVTPPAVPPPGTVTAVPGNWPTSGIVPPEYVILQYPGVGPVVVTAPPHAEPAG